MRVSTTVILPVLGVLLLASGPALAADPAPAAAPPPAAPAKLVDTVDDNKVICKTLTVTGSRLGAKKTCMTKGEWAYQHSSAMDAFRNNHPWNPTAH